MEAKSTKQLPQKGTGLDGESLSEHRSDSPTESGGGKISLDLNNIFQENSLKSETEQVLFLAWKDSQRQVNKLQKQMLELQLSPLQKNLPPPPIIIDGVKDFPKLHAELTHIAEDLQIKILNDETVKVYINDSVSYRNVSALLTKNNYSWYTYENIQNRPIKVMAKNLHHSSAKEQIVLELRNRGYKVLEATPKLNNKTKQALNMFMLTFSQDENITKIYSIANIMGMKVEIEPLETNTEVPQCKNCQDYGHTQNYCGKKPICVGCAGDHKTVDCDKTKNSGPKCVHCGGEHTANYRGCQVAKELQKMKSQQILKANMVGQPQRMSYVPIVLQPPLGLGPPNFFPVFPRTPYVPMAVQPNLGQGVPNFFPVFPGTPHVPRHVESSNTLYQLVANRLDKLEERVTTLEMRSLGATRKITGG